MTEPCTEQAMETYAQKKSHILLGRWRFIFFRLGGNRSFFNMTFEKLSCNLDPDSTARRFQNN